MDLYWLDLETTGLNPVTEVILEMALYKSTLENPFDVTKVLVHQFSIMRCIVNEFTPFIKEMHTKNGLIVECLTSSKYIVPTETMLLEVVQEVEDHHNKPTLAGNSVHFDHEFLKVHMPTLASRFSHRHYDVSSIVLFCRSMGMPKPVKKEAHRAEADVLESVELARECAEWLAHHANNW